MRRHGENDDGGLDDGPDPRTRHQRERAALGALSVVYREADAAFSPFSCPASGECCQLAITRREPWLWRAEWLRVLARLKQDGRPLPPAREDGACPLLDASGLRCSIYADRPLGCRTFFCDRIQGPERQPVEAMEQLQRRLQRLSEALDGAEAEPRSLLTWAQRERAPKSQP